MVIFEQILYFCIFRFRKFFYFLQLCSTDIENPHNFKLVDKIKRKVLVYNIREAFLESAPQLILKVTYYQLYNFFYFGTFLMKLTAEKVNFAYSGYGLATNLISLATASVRLLFLTRKEGHNDPFPSVKSLILLLPFTVGASLCAGIMWSYVYKIGVQYGLPIFFSTFLASVIFASALCLLETRGLKSKRSEESINAYCFTFMSSWISPYIITEHRRLRVAQLALNLLIAVLIPGVILKIYDFYITDEEGIVILAAVIMILPLCLTVFYLRDHHRLYKASKMGRIFSLDPVVHRSMVSDFVEDPAKFSAGKELTFDTFEANTFFS